MGAEEFKSGRLFELYTRYVGEPESKLHVYGYWMLVIGYLVAFLGVLIFLLVPILQGLYGVFEIRRVAFTLSALGLLFALFGIVLMLPVRRRGIQLAALGLAVGLAGVGLFFTIYPSQWWVTTPDYSAVVITVYSVGVAVVAGVAVLVPIATGEKAFFFETPTLGDHDQPPIMVGEATRGALFTIFDQGSDWGWRLIDQTAVANGAESYLSRLETEQRVEGIKAKVAEAGLFEIKHAAFRLYETTEGKWRWLLMRDDGSIVADSGAELPSRNAAAESVSELKEHGPTAEIIVIDDATFDLYQDDDGWRWRLVDDERSVLASSHEAYGRQEDAGTALYAFTRNVDASVHTIETYGVELFNTDDGWRWRIRGEDEAPVVTSVVGTESRSAAEEDVYDLLERLETATVLATDAPAYEVFEAGPNTWRFRLVDSVDEVVAESHEDSSDRATAENIANRMRDGMKAASVVEIDVDSFEVYQDADGWTWRLVTEQRDVLAHSTDTFETRVEAEEAVEELRTQATVAELIEFEKAAFQLYEAEDSWRWRLIDEDGNVMADSGQGDYSSKDDAASAMLTLKEHAPDAEPLEIDTAAFELYESDSSWNWRLVDPTGETIATSVSPHATRDDAHNAMTRLVERVTETERRTMTTAAFQVYAEGDEWRWQFVHEDGSILADGTDVYATRHEAEAEIDDLRKDAAVAAVEPVGRLAVQLVSDDGDWRFRLIDGDRTPIARSDLKYSTRDGVDSVVAELQRDAGSAIVYEVRDTVFLLTEDDGWNWRLLDEEHERLAVGPTTYDDLDEAENGLNRVRKLAPDAELLDFEESAFELHQASKGWQWRLIDEAQNVIAAGTEGYASLAEAETGIESIKSEVTDASILEIDTAAFELIESGGSWRWRLIDENGNELASSLGSYPDRRTAQEALNSVKEHAPDAITSVGS